MTTQMLTARQEAFCRLFVAGAGSAAEAACQAGYAAHTARAQASRLLHTPAVSARIDALRADAEQARATLCARLMAETRRLAERAEAEGKLSLAMRGVAMQMQLVKQFGLPAMPEDTAERTVAGLDAEPSELCGDIAVGEPGPDSASAAPPEVVATTEAQGATFIPAWVAAALRRCVATHVDGCARAASGGMETSTGEPALNETDRSGLRVGNDGARVPRAAEPASHAMRVTNGATAAALRGLVLADVDGCERADAPAGGNMRASKGVVRAPHTPAVAAACRSPGERAQPARSG